METPWFLASILLFSACTPNTSETSKPLPDGDDDVADTGDGDTDSPPDDTDDTQDTEEPADDTRVVTAPDWLNLRDQPSSDGAVLRALPCGATLVVRGEEEDGWLPVTGEETDGWVSKTWTARPENAPACPGPAAYGEDGPGTVADVLDVVPYVEQDCSDITWDGWPYEAQKCTYNGGLKVKVADPSAEKVAYWIADASQMIPALWSLEQRDRGAWKDALEIIANHTLYQSSRIFPLEGEIDEGTVYDFDRGVTVGCSTGCYCRINSTTRQMWCEYADKVLGIVDEDDCLDEYTTDTFTDAWAEHCLDTHRAAWTGIHHHYRAMAWWANKTVEDVFPNPETADPDDVVDLIDSLY